MMLHLLFVCICSYGMVFQITPPCPYEENGPPPETVFCVRNKLVLLCISVLFYLFIIFIIEFFPICWVFYKEEMSNIYHTEPPTSGKVLIKTNFGDIDIELWAKEAPLACRNFIQLALEGYYDNTEVNRVIKGFMVQMGDPTNTGQGGTSIWDRPFKDEVHGRIKFNHRGQIAMANANRPHSNLSQFFITLDNCDWLNGKHTIFGKVTGSTIFNVLRMGEVDTDGQDKPVDSIRILAMEVLSNPFDDIVPRATHKVVEKKSEVKEDVVKVG